MIFHFGDPYRIKLGKEWETQSGSLLAEQIRHYFYLENTGIRDLKSEMLSTEQDTSYLR